MANLATRLVLSHERRSCRLKLSAVELVENTFTAILAYQSTAKNNNYIRDINYLFYKLSKIEIITSKALICRLYRESIVDFTKILEKLSGERNIVLRSWRHFCISIFLNKYKNIFTFYKIYLYILKILLGLIKIILVNTSIYSVRWN